MTELKCCERSHKASNIMAKEAKLGWMMENLTQEYKKTFEDELDWNLLNQLHKITLQISNNCFQIKKLCVGFEITVMTLIIKFTDNKLDYSIFIAGIFIPACFWFIDSVAYYYQMKLRGIMNKITKRLKDRNMPEQASEEYGTVIEPKRAKSKRKILKAFFNHSMWLYLILAVINAMLLYAFRVGWIVTK